MTAPMSLFAACAPGLEPLLAGELATLGALGPTAVPGGVRFEGHRRVVYRANLEAGLASHVLVRVATFEAARFDVLERQLAAIDWAAWLAPGAPRAVRATAKKSRLHHTGAIAERVEAALRAQLGEAPDDEGPVPIQLRLVRDRVQVSLDTSGAPLHRRGYRTTSGPAPLREDLARALVIASGWDRRAPLVDPMCGVGTIPIEAALLAGQRAPNAGRAFAFERTPLLDPPSWAAVRAAAEARATAIPTILGRDRDAAAIEASRANAARAGVDPRFEVGPLSAPFGLDAPAGAVVTHPPFGHRMDGDRDLAPLYRVLGAAVPAGWSLALLCPDRALARRADPRVAAAFTTDAGGLKVTAWCRP